MTQVENFTLKALAAPVSGRVVSTTGVPIGGATVTLDIDSVMQPISSVQTIREGDEGFFSLGLVPPGRYRLTVVQWEHEPTRGELVVTSATQATLSGDAGPIFDIEMTPLPPRNAADRPTGSLAFDIRDSNPNPICTTGVVDCRQIENTKIEIRTTDPALVDSARITGGLFECAGGPCNNTNQKEYRIDDIPIGSYTVTFIQDDYNTEVRAFSVVPGSAAGVEEVEMVRKGELVGSFVESPGLTTGLYRDSSIYIVPESTSSSCQPGVVKDVSVPVLCGGFSTEQVPLEPAKFQSPSSRLLPPGKYGLQIVPPEGYFVAPDQQLVAGYDPFKFEIGRTEGAANRVELRPIVGNPYPVVSVRIFKPKDKFSDGPVPDLFEPLGGTPSAELQCGATTVKASEVSPSGVEFDGKTTQKLDAATVLEQDGELGICRVTVSADDFDDAIYPFGAARDDGIVTGSLSLGDDRFVDLALIVPPPVTRIVDLAGLLSWKDEGGSASVPNPVADADIAATPIVTALIAGEHAEEADTDVPPKVELLTETLAGQKSIFAPLKATWDGWAGKRQILGSTTLTFTNAAGFDDASVDIIVDGDGSQRFEAASALVIDDRLGTLDVTLNPGEGSLIGRVAIITGDPDVDVLTNLKLESTSGLAGSPIGHTGATYDVAAAAGSWETTVEIPANHRALSSDTQTQFVPAGGPSAESLFTLLELGLVDMTVTGPTDGVQYVVDTRAPEPLTSSQRILDLDVDEDGTTPEPHTIRLAQLPPGSPGAGPGVDLKRATVTVTKTSVSSPNVVVIDAQTADLKDGLSLQFAAGTKYEVDVSLQEYGKLSGTLVGTSAEIGSVNICSSAGTPATITATPTKTDTSTGSLVDDTDEANGGRPVLTTSSCGGDFTLPGEEGMYRLSIKHPEFEDLLVTEVTMPAAGGDPTLLTLAQTTLTILQSHLTVEAVNFLGDAPIVSGTDFIYYALDTTNADDDAVIGTPTRMVDGVAELNLVDPSEAYMLTVRSCSELIAAPLLREKFDGCVNRFPATVPLVVPRSTDDPPVPVTNLATAEVTLLQVGGKIDLAIDFENMAGREVCPTPNLELEFVRDFDRSQFGSDQQAEVNGEGADIPNVDSESVQTTCTTVAPALIETADTVRFESLVASGQHVIGLPKIVGFGVPTVADGNLLTEAPVGLFPDIDLDDFDFFEINYAPTSWADPVIFAVRYIAPKARADFFICGLDSCSEEFPELEVTLIHPEGGEFDATVGEFGDNGYPISRDGLDPEIDGYVVSIGDNPADLHEDTASDTLMVTAGTQGTQTITFPGSSVRVAINPQETFGKNGGDVRDLCSINPDINCPPGTGTVTLEGRETVAGPWATIKENSWEICEVSRKDYQYCDSDVSSDYVQLRAVVTQTGYIDGVTEPVDSPGVGGSVVLEPNLVKRAIVRINATAKAPDGTTVEFPPELIDSVKLVDDDGNESPYADPESGRQRTAAEDRLPSTSGCANSGNTACFDFYADPGSKFRGRADTSPSTKYLFAQSPLTEKETEIGKQVGGKTTVAITFVPAPPDAPTSVSATAGVRQATVSWTAPTSVGFFGDRGLQGRAIR